MIIVTPGHYGSATGATNPNGFSEYPETRHWAHFLCRCLGNKGRYVAAQPLPAKVRAINKLCKEREVTLAIEIHFNSAKNSLGQHVGEGSETLYYPDSERGKYYATRVQEVLGRLFPPDRGVKEGWYRRRQTSGALYFLEYTHCPAIIIEPEFIHLERRITQRREACCDDLSQLLLTL